VAEPLDGDVEPEDGVVVLVEPELELFEELVAADAMPAAPKLAPITIAPVTSAVRALLGLAFMVDPFGSARASPGTPPPCRPDLNRSCGPTGSRL
jgi:hypothetical protein